MRGAGNIYRYGAGSLLNQGTIQADVSGQTLSVGIDSYGFTNNGTLRAINGGTLSIGGTYSLAGGVLNVGLSSAAVFGHVQFTGPLVADGTFTVNAPNGYLPNPGDTFQVMTFPSVTGAFTCLNLDLGGGILLQPQFSATDLTLLATAYATNSSRPTLQISQAPGGVYLQWPLGFPGWTLQSATNVNFNPVVPVSTVCGNQATVPLTGPRQFFRLSKPN
jgi:hypothetical protein